MKKRILCVLLIAAMLVCFSSCGRSVVAWNGQTEVFAELLMVMDVRDPYAYAGMVDHIFVGTVEQIEKNVLPDRSREHMDHFSVYQIHVDRNLKGTLTEEIVCYKMGGFRKDGTMLLVAAETPDGEMVVDSGLPEAGKQYVFMAYSQTDGSLHLSELFDNREYSEELLAEYMDYIENEVPSDRERAQSKYSR